MKLDTIFNRLWNDYISQNPSAGEIYNLFLNEEEVIVNDHIAFRTLDYPEINIEVLAKPFISNDYIAKGEYVFKEKHLFAKHYELAGDSKSPRIFISQLILSECSEYIQKTLREAFEKANLGKSTLEDLIFSGSLFSPLSYSVFNRLREESEYAAWFYVFGFRANHFTVSINSLKKYNQIFSVNELLKKNGFVAKSADKIFESTNFYRKK